MFVRFLARHLLIETPNEEMINLIYIAELMFDPPLAHPLGIKTGNPQQ